MMEDPAPSLPTELRFTITAAHTRRSVADALAHQAAKDAALLQRVSRRQQRALKPLLLLVLPAGCLLYIALQPGVDRQMKIALLLAAVLLVPAWHYAERLLAPLRRRMAQAPAHGGGKLHAFSLRLAETTLRIRLAAVEGDYRLRFDTQGFTVVRGQQAPARIAWHDVTHVTETAGFHVIGCAPPRTRQRMVWIPKQSDAIDGGAWPQHLAQFLQRCPPSQSAA